MKKQLFIFSLVIISLAQLSSQNMINNTLHGDVNESIGTGEFGILAVGPFTPVLDTLNLGLNLNIRAEDIDAGSFVALSALGTYQRYLWGITDLPDGTQEYKTFRVAIDFNLRIQSPTTTTDTTSTLNRIFSSGGVGNIDVIFKSGFISKDNKTGIYFNLCPKLSWVNSKTHTDKSSEKFSYFSVNSSITGWLGPLILNAGVEYYNTIDNDSLNVISSAIQGQTSFRINAGYQIRQDYYLEFKYSIPSLKLDSRMSNVELGFTKALSF